MTSDKSNTGVATGKVPGGHPVAVISYGYWERRFARASDILSRILTLNGTTYSIQGVAVKGFAGENTTWPTLWIPMAMQSQVMPERPGLLKHPTSLWVTAIARLGPGKTVRDTLPADSAPRRRPNPQTEGMADLRPYSLRSSSMGRRRVARHAG